MPTDIRLSSINLWGKIILYLRQNNYRALHVICGTINDVEIVDDTLILKTDEEYVFNHLSENANMTVLKRALINQDAGLDIKIELTKPGGKTEADIEKLTALAGEYLKITGGENEQF